VVEKQRGSGAEQDIIDAAFCRALVILTQIQHSYRQQLMPIQSFGNGTRDAILNRMVRIDDESAGPVTKLRLSGRIQSEDLASIRLAMNDATMAKMLDLSDVNLVDIAVVRFLICCEDEGVELVECPPYVREWMTRERAQGERL
jgi:hypothetical protein